MSGVALLEDSTNLESMNAGRFDKSDDCAWKRILRGCAVVLCIAGATMASNIIGKELTEGSSAAVPPFLLVYFNVSFDATALMCGCRDKPRRMTDRQIVKTALVLMLLYQAGNVLYFIALSQLDISTASLIYQSTTLWVAIFSVLILGESFDPIKGCSVAVTLAGVATIVADDSSGEQPSSGAATHTTSEPLHVLLLCASACAWALYEVLVKRLMPHATTADLLLFTGWRGVLNLLLLWPVAVVLLVTRVEVLPALPASVAGATCAMAAISVLSTFLIAAGIVETSPLYIRIGNALVSPMSIGWDLARGSSPGYGCYVGVVFVIVGFLFANLTWRSKRWVCRLRNDVLQEPIALEDDR
jgi:drug/metabolite transporter (DMT)-like permease